MLGFTLSSLLCGLAGSLNLLIAARILQGRRQRCCSRMMRVLYVPQQRRRAFARLGMTLGLAAIFGQILGGFIIEANLFGSGWRMIFLINLPIGALALWAARRIRIAGGAGAAAGRRWPVAGGDRPVAVAAAAAGGPARGWPWWIAPMLALAMVTLWGFLRWERRLALRGDDAVLDPALLREQASRRVWRWCWRFMRFLVFLVLRAAAAGGGGADATRRAQPVRPAARRCWRAGASVGAALGQRRTERGRSDLRRRVGAVDGPGAVGRSAGASAAAAAGVGGAGIRRALSMTPLLNLVLGLAQERQAGMAAGTVATVQQWEARSASWSAASASCRCWRTAARRNAMRRPLPALWYLICWRWALPDLVKPDHSK